MSMEKQLWRFFVAHKVLQDAEVVLEDEEHHYLSSVLRLRAGEEIEIGDCAGFTAQAILTEVTKKRAVARTLRCQVHERPFVKIGLLIGQTKPQTLEDIVYQASELGAEEISIVKTAKCQSKAPIKVEKIQRIAHEALRVSKGAFAPQLNHYNAVTDSLELLNNYGTVLLCDEPRESGGKISLPIWNACEAAIPKIEPAEKLTSEQRNRTSILVIVGPEGSFTNEEKQLFYQKDVQSVHLGPSILRASTATAHALSVCLARLASVSLARHG